MNLITPILSSNLFFFPLQLHSLPSTLTQEEMHKIEISAPAHTLTY